jgi:hypothetical protein
VNRNSPLFIVKSNITWLWNKREQIRKKMNNNFAIIVLQPYRYWNFNHEIKAYAICEIMKHLIIMSSHLI